MASSESSAFDTLNKIELPLRRVPPLEPVPGSAHDLNDQAALAIEKGREYLFAIQRQEHFWCAELESNATITSEYIMMCQMLGLIEELETRRDGLAKYLLGNQNADGSWSIANCWDGDTSTTAEVYLALRILGIPQDDDRLRRAENYIRRRGGLETIRIFTRIFFAMFGLIPWEAIPAIPPETILLSSNSPINIYALSSWARGTMVPLFIIFHYRPIFELPNGYSSKNDWLDHLWLNPDDKKIPYCAPWTQLLIKHGPGWKTLFGFADSFLKVYEKSRIPGIRKLALDRCTEWVLERQEESGDWAGIFPPMLNGVIALHLQGYELDSEPVKKGIDAIHSFFWEDESGARVQACVSPIWDTVLATIGLIDSGTDPSDPRIRKALQWVLDRQLLVDYGDWKVCRPELASGGWSFEYNNSWYPDVDDTAAVILALLKQGHEPLKTLAVQRAIEWVLGMQNEDGGWAAFDVDNCNLFLNEIPFSDMDSLCDPSTADVTGRVLEALGLALKLHTADDLPEDLAGRIRSACERAITYLRLNQEIQGSWFGRWGVNYIYGTSNVLAGLSRMKVYDSDPMIQHALSWLKHVQNPDGGWGESLASYSDKRWMGRGDSTASQTAWALIGLLSYLPSDDESIQRGIRWLVRHQIPAHESQAFEAGKALPIARGATWEEEYFTGTGFPNHFYLRYHLYRHYFPMMALGRYLAAQKE